ncbi:MAG: pseudouridine synthase [Patescibacteria group bacterium]
MRINKFIGTNTNFSRRNADQLIAEGKVTLNGKIVDQLGTIVDPIRDKVKVNGKLVLVRNQNSYIALNKPRGYVTSRKDDMDRPTVMDLVPSKFNLKPIGRLDVNTEGLLLFSNDGEFINRHTHPKFECEKEYAAVITGKLTDEEKIKLEKGIKIETYKTSPCKIKILKKISDETYLRIIIHEGRKRQIRKMFAAFEHPVKYLERLRIGKIALGDVKRGKFRFLTTEEINAN